MYEFEPDIVARMLSPKLLRKDVKSSKYPALGDYECLIDEPTVQHAMQQLPNLEYTDWDPSEALDYTSMATFLTECIEECDNIYDVIYQEQHPTKRR